MKKIEKEFELEYAVNKDIVDAYCIKNNLQICIQIPLDKFQFWLLINNKLKWHMSLKERRRVARVEELEGFMSYEEYWMQDLVIEDLYEYITSNPIVYRGIVYSNSTKSLLTAFNNHKLKSTTHGTH